MKLTLQSTTKIGFLVVDGVNVEARLWIGETEGGTECFAFIVRIAVKDGQEAEFERELNEKSVRIEPPEDLPLKYFFD